MRLRNVQGGFALWIVAATIACHGCKDHKDQANGPAGADTRPADAAGAEVKVEPRKDPLAYKVHQGDGFTLATFDNWKTGAVPNVKDGILLSSFPDGRQKDFGLLIYVNSPAAADLASFFDTAPQQLRQLIPGLMPTGEPKSTRFGGDEAHVIDYQVDGQQEQAGQKGLARAVFMRKKDVIVIVLGNGTEAGFKEFGKAIEITAQSISFRESALEPALVGTWSLSSYRSSGAGSQRFSYSSETTLTIYPNGSFTEHRNSMADGASTATAFVEGAERGTVVKRGKSLTFHYDNGKTWNTDYELGGGALRLGGNTWLKQ